LRVLSTTNQQGPPFATGENPCLSVTHPIVPRQWPVVPVLPLLSISARPVTSARTVAHARYALGCDAALLSITSVRAVGGVVSVVNVPGAGAVRSHARVPVRPVNCAKMVVASVTTVHDVRKGIAERPIFVGTVTPV